MSYTINIQQQKINIMEFPKRMVALRKKKGLTQQNLADQVSINVIQIKRYESGNTQPSLDVIRKLAVVLNVTADTLLFDENERDPADDLKLQFEAINKFDSDEKYVVKALLEGLILKHQAKLSLTREGQLE